MPSIHWIVPIICSSFFSVGTFLLFQSVLNYLQDAYPEKAASVLAGNDFFRSMMGACFPLFSIQMFNHLGFHVFWGCVLLGCLSLLFIPIPFVLYRVSHLPLKSYLCWLAFANGFFLAV
jgi:DHA1 family multidrug resistance protein-like MFS transporter